MPKLLLLGWDAADWQVIHPLLDRGEMPALARLISEGVMGDLATLEPPLSPILWNSIATGVGGHRHGILGFTEPDPHTGGVRPVSSSSRRVKALWNIAVEKGLRSHVVGWFASHPAEPLPGGTVVSDAFVRSFPPPGEPWPLFPGTVHPPELASTLADLRLHFDEVDPALLQLFVPEAAKVDQATEPQLFQLSKLIAEMCSLHNAATWILERREWDFLAVYQPAIDHFSHGFMKFRAPRLPWIDERRFRLFRGVMDACYKFHDLMLARLLQLAGPETAVILLSDHGYHSGAGRRRELPGIFAAPALEHRSQGILVLRGPGLKRDERVSGAGLLDIAPTALALLGLPAGADMEGRVLAEAWAEPPDLTRIRSWEETAPRDGMRTSQALSLEDSAALLQQFVDLGYVEPVGSDAGQAQAQTIREQHWNLAQIHLAAGRLCEACPLLEGLVQAVPERGDWGLALANCLAGLGLPAEARTALEHVIAQHRDSPLAQAMLGQVELSLGNYEASLRHLLQARQAEPDIPELPLLIARTLFGLGRAREAEFEFERAARVDPTSGIPHQGLAQALLKQRRWEEAAGAALTALAYQFSLPVAHFTLGRALSHLGLLDRAEAAFRAALALPGPVWEAHRWLAAILASQPGREAEAAEQRQLARGGQERAAAAETRRQAALAEVRAVRARPPSVVPSASAGPAPEPLSPPGDFLIVSGLPRSGTSLVMQMLAAAGVPILSDALRRPDLDNPEGYLEWEGAKRLGAQPEIIREARGKAVKIVSPLLPLLPNRHRYRILFVRRPLEQVARSQAVMIARRKGQTEVAEVSSQLIERLGKHLEWTTQSVSALANVQWLEIDYPALVRDPEPWAAKIAHFCGLVAREAVSRMVRAVRPALHRNR